MIFFGTTGIKSTIKKGEFLCPNCNVINPYAHKKVTKFFTLYFIPLIPLGKIGEFVECQDCKITYVSDVLDYKLNFNEKNIQSIFEQAIQQSMIQIMLADGEIDGNEMKMVQLIINQYSYNDISLDDLNQFVSEIKIKQEPISKYLAAIAPLLNDLEKESILKCGLKVASADGKVDDFEIGVILDMANALEVPSSNLKVLMQGINHN